jgi:mRNA-degrading endonuclease RelE of RelBE toxin-antitoxin system
MVLRKRYEWLSWNRIPGIQVARNQKGVTHRIRIGNYHVICEIYDSRLLATAIAIGIDVYE